ncbi:MAG: hypothetical protein A2V66_04205 [Ignavibacteria bacterium RBG_13_36_8]|nr:MAG: hypothetical protein A2V66_04205 [Ignavibacteria bacterium RBG_13_36_8]
MNYVDYIICVIIIIGFVLGFKDGLVRKIIGLVGLILGIAIALEYSSTLGKLILPIFNDEMYLAEIVAGIILFLATILAASIIKRLVHPRDKVNKFMNQFLGGIAGIIQIIIFLSGFLLFLNIFSFPKENDRNNSITYGPISQIIPTAIDFLLKNKDEPEKLFKEYIEGKDTTLSNDIMDTTTAK